MPSSGTMDVEAFAPNVGEIHGYKTEEWKLKGAQILNVLYEVSNEPFPGLMPVTFHPVIPAYAILNVTHYPESPAGPFTIADVRVGCRAGVRPRGFTLKSYVSTAAAAQELTRRWGYPASVADVSMRAFHDRVVGRVKADGRTILEVEMLDRDFIGGNDIQYVSSMHLCRNREDGKLVVVQLDPEWTFHQGGARPPAAGKVRREGVERRRQTRADLADLGELYDRRCHAVADPLRQRSRQGRFQGHYSGRGLATDSIARSESLAILALARCLREGLLQVKRAARRASRRGAIAA